MQAWLNRPLGAATLGCGAGVALSRDGSSVTTWVEGLRHDKMKGVETVAQSVARRKLRREKALGAGAGAEEVLETEIRPPSFMTEGWGARGNIASLSHNPAG